MANKYVPIVAAFGALMIEKLEANDHKPTWTEEDVGDLVSAMHNEACELEEAVDVLLNAECGMVPDETRRAVALEAADVANFALMIVDVCGGLPVSDPRVMPDKCDTMTLNDGTVVNVIDYGAAPPPPEGVLQCLHCGNQVAWKRDVAYRDQSDCGACTIEGHSMMSSGWNGWNCNGRPNPAAISGATP